MNVARRFRIADPVEFIAGRLRGRPRLSLPKQEAIQIGFPVIHGLATQLMEQIVDGHHAALDYNMIYIQTNHLRSQFMREPGAAFVAWQTLHTLDRKSTRLNSSH